METVDPISIQLRQEREREMHRWHFTISHFVTFLGAYGRYDQEICEILTNPMRTCMLRLTLSVCQPVL